MGSGLETVVGRVLIVGVRVSALMAVAPFLGSATISPRIKAGFTVVLTALLYPAVSAYLPSVSGAKGWQVAGGEFVVGLDAPGAGGPGQGQAEGEGQQEGSDPGHGWDSKVGKEKCRVRGFRT